MKQNRIIFTKGKGLCQCFFAVRSSSHGHGLSFLASFKEKILPLFDNVLLWLLVYNNKQYQGTVFIFKT